jgi:septin family protein
MNPVEEFSRKHAEAMGAVVKPTILVCGYTGAGKTSLIQSICGKDTVPDERIGHGKPMTRDFIPYRNDFVDF